MKKKTVLVQTRLPLKTAKWIKSRAHSEGLSMAAYLRRLIIEHETFERAILVPRNFFWRPETTRDKR